MSGALGDERSDGGSACSRLRAPRHSEKEKLAVQEDEPAEGAQ
jgi:hypothetical protein